MNWLHYLVEANIYLSVFYLFYCLLLNKETHYTLNRIYLLSSCVLSFLLPLMQIGRLKPTEIAAQVGAAPVTGKIIYTAHATQAVNQAAENPFTLQDWLFRGYLVGAVVLFAVLSIKLYKLWLLSRAKPAAEQGGYKLIYLDGSNSAFSFFNFLFMGTAVPKADTIIRHELVHIRQKHSADIILLEVIKIINWFNPLIYLLQQSLKTVHEYIADEQTAAAETDTLAYSTFLVNSAYGLSGSPITNSFFNYNLLKKRIMMLHQQRSGGLARLKYLLAAPLCAALLCVSTLSFSKTYGWVDLAPGQANLNPVTGKTTTGKTDSTSKIKVRRSSYTSKGYRYKEDGYLVKNKSDFRVIIFEKNGEGKAYFRNSATAAELKLLEEKYGYTFPNMEIYATPPPPPAMAPAPPVQVKFPPPVVHSPAKTSGTVKFPPPIVKPDIQKSNTEQVGNEPAALDTTKKNPGQPPVSRLSNGALKLSASVSNMVLDVSEKNRKQIPLIIIDGKKYIWPRAMQPNERLILSAEDSVVSYRAGNGAAIAKWGPDAAKGVIDLHGHATAKIE